MEGPADGIFGPATRSGVRLFQGGAGLPVDGVAGPLTLTAARERGWNHKTSIPAMVVRTAEALDIEPAALEALRRVETGAAVGGEDRIRFEPHVFLRKRPDLVEQIPYTRSSRGAWSTTKSETCRAAFDRAFALAPKDAVESTSWGLWQVMGWALLKTWSDPTEAVCQFYAEPISASYAVLASWIKTNKRFLTAIRAKDWESVARRYNGDGNNVQNYARKMREAYEQIVQ